MTYQPYSYLCADLLTNQILGELPLTNVTFSTVLNDIGSFQGSVLLSDPVIQRMNLPEITAPGRTALYVDRGGTLVWGGIIWQRTYAVGSQMGSPYQMQITADEFPSYFKQRILASDKTYTNEDQLAIATDLINWAQRFSSIGVHVPTPGSSGILLTETYKGTDYKTFWSMVTEMASMSQGFDAMIDVGYGAGGQPIGVPGKVLTLSYPRRGRRAPDNGLVLDFPGNIAQYSWPEDATQMANTIYDTAPGSGTTALTSTATDSAPLTAGYPLLEATHSYQDSYITQAILDARAKADVQAYSMGVTLPVVTLAPGAWPQPGEYIGGDDVVIEISDYRFPRQGDGSPGLSTYMRINRIDYTPPGKSQAEIVQLTLGPVPA